MHIRDRLGGAPTLSFEFFPPKTDEAEQTLRATLERLGAFHPAFVSITYGAGGTDAVRTRDLVVDLTGRSDVPTMAHLTCMGHTRAELAALLEDYRANGVVNILALGGDPPADGSPPTGDFRYAAELVDLIRGTGDFTVGVAAFPELHPRSEATEDDRRYLAEKLGRADFGITQFFFDPVPYFRMVEDLDALGCRVPVLPGIMPVTTPASVRRFAAMNGSRVPPALFERLEVASPADRLEIAVEQTTALARRLLDGGAPGIHLYTLNRSEAAARIAEALGFA
ncbi:MAG: 5,10-methylenetetrahydrofolate reductase [Actinobacteria bacterium]|nr:5,10-methylenetetrahydrofolate reductase [Actinomycetota bacterium]